MNKYNNNRPTTAKDLSELGIYHVADEEYNERLHTFLQHVQNQTDEAMRRDEEDINHDDDDDGSECDGSESDSEGEDTE